MKGPSDPLGWARKPASDLALKRVFEAGRQDRRFVDIKAKLIKDGIATESGKLLFRWQNNAWVKNG